MDYHLPLTPEELEEMRKNTEWSEWARNILPLIIEVHDNEFKRNLAKREKCHTRTSTFLWITLNPKPCTTDALLNGVAKILKKKWIATSEWLYVIEQRKTPEYYIGRTSYEDNGKHVHLIVKTKYKKNHAIRELHSTLKKIMSKESIDVRIMQDKFLQDKVDYVLGKKTGEGKDIKQDGDIVYRQIKNLDKYYSNAPQIQEEKTEETPS